MYLEKKLNKNISYLVCNVVGQDTLFIKKIVYVKVCIKNVIYNLQNVHDFCIIIGCAHAVFGCLNICYMSL
jgi:hypothetical protein